MKRINCFIMIFVILSACLFGGCSGTQDTVKEEKSGYQVYYADENYQLVSENFAIDGEDSQAVLDKLMAKALETEKVSLKLTPSTDILVLNHYIDDKVLYVYFNDAYNLLSTVDEVLFRAAFVRTMTQLDTVNYVSFYVADQPLATDSGVVVGIMKASDFISGTDEPDSVQWVDATLYFSNEEGTGLVAETREVAYSAISQFVQIMLEQLIAGPQTKGLKATLPSNLKVIGVSIKDGICYVNLSKAFLDSAVDASSEIIIYSVVNTLCSLNSVKKVQFLINGSSEVNFRDTISLTEIFERNLDLIIEEKTPSE